MRIGFLLAITADAEICYVSIFMTNTKNKKNNREFLKTVGNKLEWIFRPYVQGPSLAI